MGVKCHVQRALFYLLPSFGALGALLKFFFDTNENPTSSITITAVMRGVLSLCLQKKMALAIPKAFRYEYDSTLTETMSPARTVVLSQRASTVHHL